MTGDTSPHVSTACLHCGSTDKPTGQYSRLCVGCYRIPGLMNFYLCRDLPTAMDACPYPPGSAEKIAWMQARAAQGFSCFNPLDKDDHDGTMPGYLPPQKTEVFALPMFRIRGIERQGIYFRARPAYDGKKTSLGLFKTFEEALAVCQKWWQSQLGLFYEFGGAMRHCRLERKAKRARWARPLRSRDPWKNKTPAKDQRGLFDDENSAECFALRLYDPAAA